MIIDFHTHPEFKSLNELYSPEEFIAGMDKGGVDISCLFGNDQADPGDCPKWRDSRFMAVPTNFSDEQLSAFCNHFPTRLIGFTSINPNRYQPERKVERAIKEFGMKAVKLYPHSGFYPNDPRLSLTYKFCQEMGIPVVIHTGPKAVRWQWMKYNQPIYVDDVATNFPDLRIVMCHGGYPWTEEFITVAYTNPNIWVDLTFMEVIEETYLLPGLVENTVKRLNKLIGAKRLLWGTEGPYMNLPLYGVHDPSYYEISQQKLVKRFDFFSEEDKQDILGNNAARLLGIH
ncbi:MAG: amidohydrolase [Chloroflexi bacterium]|jgi:predicted TIM-barrel fold metal-dependent hydrolase|nr:amidohydrolase [Chloroflexota bacterium]